MSEGICGGRGDRGGGPETEIDRISQVGVGCFVENGEQWRSVAESACVLLVARSNINVLPRLMAAYIHAYNKRTSSWTLMETRLDTADDDYRTFSKSERRDEIGGHFRAARIDGVQKKK